MGLITENTAAQVGRPIETVGMGCYTAPTWDRNICQMRRWSDSDNRFYYDDKLVFYRGATFLSDHIAKMAPEMKFLDSWRRGMTQSLTQDGFEKWMGSVADYGTLMHTLCDAYIAGNLTYNMVQEEVAILVKNSAIPKDVEHKVLNKMLRNILAFRTFVTSTGAKTLAMEQMVKSDVIFTATPIDMVARINTEDGPCWALLNLKSSENAQNHEYQCAVELVCAEETIGQTLRQIEDLPIRVMTFRPLSWRTAPNYELKDYTDKAIALKDVVVSAASLLAGLGAMSIPSMEIPLWDGTLEAETMFTMQSVLTL